MGWRDTIVKKDAAPVSESKSSWRDTITKTEEPSTESNLVERIPADVAPVEAAPEDSFSLGEALGNTVGGGLAGAGLGYGVKGAAWAGDKVIGSMGNLDADQMDYITANRDKYKNAAPLDQKLNEFRDLANKTRQTSFDAKDAALKSLEGAPAVPADDYRKSIAKVVGKEDYSQPFGDNVKNEVFQSSMAEVQPNIEANQSKLKELEAKMTELQSGKPNRDVRLQANQQAKIEKAQIKLQRMDEKIATATEKAQETAIKRREDFLKNQDIDQNKTQFIQTDKNLKKFDDQMKQIEEFKLQKAKLIKDTQAQIEKANKKAKETIRTKAGIPENLTKVAPELSDRKLLTDSLQGSLKNALGIAEDVDSIPAMSVAKGVIPALREGNSFNGTGTGYSEKFDTDVSETVRKDFGDRFQDYDTNMKRSSDAIKAQDQFLSAGAKLDDSDNIIIPDNARNKIAGIAASSPDKMVDERANIQGLNQKLKDLGIVDQNVDLLDDMKASAIKQGVKDASVLDISGYDAANITKPTGIIKAAKDNLGTKLQEQAALIKGSGLGKTTSKLVKNAPGILGAVGAMVGAGSAMAAGDIDQNEASVLAATDIVNPLPLDTTGAYVEGKKAFNDSINEQKMTQEYFDGGEVNYKDPWAAALSAGAVAAVEPTKDLAEGAANKLLVPSTGNVDEERQMLKEDAARKAYGSSPAALDKLRSQMGTFNELKQKKASDNKKPDFKGFQKVSSQDLSGLAQQVANHSQGNVYAAPLEKAANAKDERTKNAVLWGLYQQPAFRQIYKELNPEDDEIEG